MISASYEGEPVDVELVSVDAVSVRENGPVTVHDVTSDSIGSLAAPGILDVRVDLPEKVKHVKSFRFTVQYPEGGLATVWVSSDEE